jgi:hypothetical protein
MTTHEERQRLAAMGNALRPDWPVGSLYTLLTHEIVVKRAYRDVAAALALVATDPETRTPARLHEPGPWWQASVKHSPDRAPSFDPMCHVCWEPHDPAVSCAVPPRPREPRDHLYEQARRAIRGDTDE